jgi:hypothetical protein
VVVFAISGVFLLKPGSSPSQAIVTPPHVPANNTSGTNSSATNSSATTSGSTGSSTATQPMDTAAEVNQYLDEVDNQGGDFDYVSDSDLLALGNATCADFEEGASVEGTVDDALNYAENDSDGLDDQDMGVILGAATSTLCPVLRSRGAGVVGAGQRQQRLTRTIPPRTGSRHCRGPVSRTATT